MPLEVYGDAVRETLRTSSDPKLIGLAVSALVRGYKAPLPLRDAQTGEWTDWGGFGSPAHREYRRQHPRPTPRIEHLDLIAWQEDVTLLEQIDARDRLPDDLRGQVERYVAAMYELRRRFESQPTDD